MLGRGEELRDGWMGTVHTWMLRTETKRGDCRPDKGLVGRVTVTLQGLLQAGELWLWREEEPLHGNSATGHLQLLRAVI